MSGNCARCDGPTAEEMSDAAERLAWAASAERKMAEEDNRPAIVDERSEVKIDAMKMKMKDYERFEFGFGVWSSSSNPCHVEALTIATSLIPIPTFNFKIDFKIEFVLPYVPIVDFVCKLCIVPNVESSQKKARLPRGHSVSRQKSYHPYRTGVPTATATAR